MSFVCHKLIIDLQDSQKACCSAASFTAGWKRDPAPCWQPQGPDGGCGRNHGRCQKER
jgi:hypothetical protein